VEVLEAFVYIHAMIIRAAAAAQLGAELQPSSGADYGKSLQLSGGLVNVPLYTSRKGLFWNCTVSDDTRQDAASQALSMVILLLPWLHCGRPVISSQALNRLRVTTDLCFAVHVGRGAARCALDRSTHTRTNANTRNGDNCQISTQRDRGA
jgi:hypothetical protein